MPRSKYLTNVDPHYRYKWRVYLKKLVKKRPYGSMPCVYCKSPYEIWDHIKPHKGDVRLLLDPKNLQPMCRTCHSSLKAAEEGRTNHGLKPKLDDDGYPITTCDKKTKPKKGNKESYGLRDNKVDRNNT